MRYPTFALMVIAALSLTCSANATGLVTVQQADGSIQRYPESTLHVVGRTLKITTADKKGTLVITDAACSYVEKLLRCLPYAVVLHQRGTFPIAISSGVIYFNPTYQRQPLKYSSTQIAPNGVLGTLRSVHGTYVTISGHIDGGGKRQ